jgi:hypothetical protein
VKNRTAAWTCAYSVTPLALDSVKKKKNKKKKKIKKK